jgi:hypothetical protein
MEKMYYAWCVLTVMIIGVLFLQIVQMLGSI